MDVGTEKIRIKLGKVMKVLTMIHITMVDTMAVWAAVHIMGIMAHMMTMLTKIMDTTHQDMDMIGTHITAMRIQTGHTELHIALKMKRKIGMMVQMIKKKKDIIQQEKKLRLMLKC